MDEITFLIQGSSPTPYKTTFTKNGQNITATCTCMGSAFGLACKHRIGILTGNIKKFKIIDGDKKKIEEIKSWLPNSDVEKALNEVLKIEKEIDDLKADLKNAKKYLSATLID